MAGVPRGSSGGMVSWLASKMLEDGLVDAVIHVKDGPDPEHMYTYQVSHNVDELKTGAKSKYYPIEMSEVLSYVRDHDGKYLFIGIPCFVKAIRLLRRQDEVLNKRIRYCIGLVCGHLKSDFFAKSEAWESGVPLDDIARVDFRHKTPGGPASDYAVEVRRTDGENQSSNAPLSFPLQIGDWATSSTMRATTAMMCLPRLQT